MLIFIDLSCSPLMLFLVSLSLPPPLRPVPLELEYAPGLSIFILVATDDGILDSIGKPVVGDHLHPFMQHVSAISAGTGRSI